MATYYVSGVWKDHNKKVTHLFIHILGADNLFQTGNKTTEAQVIQMHKMGNKFLTMTWNYKTASWVIGEDVVPVDGANGKYLRTIRDGKITNNLDQIINMAGVV